MFSLTMQFMTSAFIDFEMHVFYISISYNIAVEELTIVLASVPYVLFCAINNS